MKRVDSRRRGFLRAAGISVALPALPSAARVVAGQSITEKASSNSTAPPRRMVCVGNEFGLFPGAFWPTAEKLQERSSRLLDPLIAHRDHFTLFRHLDHGVKGGHFAVHTFLTGVKSTEAKGMPEAGMSLDQRAAEHVGSKTRFPSLTIGSEGGLHGGCRMSWTRSGTRIPPIEGPRELFTKLFVDGGESAKQQMLDRIDLESSILDTVLADANSLSKRLNSSDRDKLDEYLSSIRDVELKLTLDRKWQHVSKPDAPIDPPVDEGLTKDLPKIYDLVALALQTDSTRIATIEVGGSFAASDLGIKKGYHALSHHGQVQENIEQLLAIELYQVEQFARFLERLRSIVDPNSDGTLLDHTMALFGSGMGNANSHTNHDLPVILAGGGFRHGRTLSLPDSANQRIPLTNLFVSMLQQFGVETDTFATSTGTLRGLETSRS